jgi:Putative beta-barrel porin 2
MKKIFVSTGLAAISAAGLQSVQADTSDIISPKAWSISGTLRGFYDDNYNLANTKKGSWGAELDPSVSYNLPLRQTDIGGRVYYGLYYYDDRRDLLGWDNSYDQQVQADFWLTHAFNSRWKFSLTDTLGYGFEPTLAQNVGTQVATYRVNGDNLSNHAHLSLDTQWTREFGTSLHYGNDFYNYNNSGASIVNSAFPPGVGFYQTYPVKGNTAAGNNPNQYSTLGSSGASLAGLLDRVEQNIGLDLTWTFSPETMVLFGYSYSWSSYLGNEPIAAYNYEYKPASALATSQSYVYTSGSRDGSSHNAYVGINKQLTAKLTLAMTVGVAYSANDNDPFQHNAEITPTANLSLSYNYTPGSYVQFGVTQSQNSTDTVQPGTDGSLTQYQNSTVVYADINHHITHSLFASVIGRYGYSSYRGGYYNSSADQDINVGVNLTYNFNRHFSADLGYNFDDLVSDVAGRSYVRNRVYLGVTASY